MEAVARSGTCAAAPVETADRSTDSPLAKGAALAVARNSEISRPTRPSGPGTCNPASASVTMASNRICSSGNDPSAAAAGTATSFARNEIRAGALTTMSPSAASNAGASVASASTVRNVAARVAGSIDPSARAVTMSLRSSMEIAPPVASANVALKSTRLPTSRASTAPLPATNRSKGAVGIASARTVPWIAARSKIGSALAESSRSKRSVELNALSG